MTCTPVVYGSCLHYLILFIGYSHCPDWLLLWRLVSRSAKASDSASSWWMLERGLVKLGLYSSTTKVGRTGRAPYEGLTLTDSPWGQNFLIYQNGRQALYWLGNPVWSKSCGHWWGWSHWGNVACFFFTCLFRIFLLLEHIRDFPFLVMSRWNCRVWSCWHGQV